VQFAGSEDEEVSIPYTGPVGSKPFVDDTVALIWLGPNNPLIVGTISPDLAHMDIEGGTIKGKLNDYTAVVPGINYDGCSGATAATVNHDPSDMYRYEDDLDFYTVPTAGIYLVVSTFYQSGSRDYASSRIYGQDASGGSSEHYCDDMRESSVYGALWNLVAARVLIPEAEGRIIIQIKSGAGTACETWTHRRTTIDRLGNFPDTLDAFEGA
tara:strand:+ start:10251 stop:10886 length:636 start_codon:yes stop_codon:yes gene_type:complete